MFSVVCFCLSSQGGPYDHYPLCIGLHHTGAFLNKFNFVQLGPHCIESSPGILSCPLFNDPNADITQSNANSP